MRGLGEIGAVYLHREAVDFRKSINGLSVIVEQQMDLSPYLDAVFVFCNKRRDKIKVLYWDQTGFCLWYKHLEQDKFQKLHRWLDKSLPSTPPKSALGKALGYAQKQWPRLIGYLDDGDYPIDNNRAENAIRPFVIGRKNWLFSGSVQGAKASANLYSLIETAKVCGLNPYDYLKRVFTELPNAKTLEDVDALLPWALQSKKV